MKLRKLNESGLRQFEQFIVESRNGNTDGGPPIQLLNDTETSIDIEGAPELQPLTAAPSRAYDIAVYLNDTLKNIPTEEIEGDDGLGNPGLWGALGLYYYDLITPKAANGQKAPLAVNCYIPEVNSAMAGNRYYRHRFAGAYRIYKSYGEFSLPLLATPVSKRSSLYIKITDSVFYTETRCLVEAIYFLYFDKDKETLRPGWSTKNQLGNFHRLLTVVDQLDLTYDLLGIDGKTLIKHLPIEFKQWINPNTPK